MIAITTNFREIIDRGRVKIYEPVPAG